MKLQKCPINLDCRPFQGKEENGSKDTRMFILQQMYFLMIINTAAKSHIKPAHDLIVRKVIICSQAKNKDISLLQYTSSPEIGTTEWFAKMSA